ncbi:MAG: voltage-gated potassium channel [Syntrophus sp. PtaU1.Bin208]|nr:MAG: voltage-gated potassium channel [Syntrophus sp. PtaU1.Bin208]
MAMRQPIKSMIHGILKARFSYLFFTVVLLFLLRPFVAIPKAVTFVTDIFVWFLIISCVWAVHEKRKHQWVVIVMAATTVLCDGLDFLLKNELTSWTSQILMVLFLGYAVVAILFYLARQEKVTADMIMAGASEYVLIGVLWAALYSLIETVYPGSFSFAGAKDRSGFLYFSFVTLTTTGYGDLLPVSIQARSLAMFEQLTGQLFIAITVARLVSLYTVSSNKKNFV